uniref:Endonuclease domain-containing 1 protein-like n=1 Tax=Anabas testudineus TaxID=64144 RepID=A0A3Q1JY81_ANATE
MWCLLPLAVLLLLSISPTETEVVQSMSQCEGFLLNETHPNIPGVLEDGEIQNQNRYKVICQTYENKERFVTLYDTKNKIPVLSAYKYRGEENSEEKEERPENQWKIEPQLEERDSMSNMWDDTYRRQASNADYRNTQNYTRGHLFPCCHASNNDDKIPTFTLTNIVPQTKSFNCGSWQKMESRLKYVLEKHCINNNDVPEGFVVTGAKPGTEKLNNKINIPSVLWSAFCCYNKTTDKWIAGAHWGLNRADGPDNLEMKTLEELQQELGIEVFPNTQCPNKTVTEFHSELDHACQCPPEDTTTSAPPTTTTNMLNPTTHEQPDFCQCPKGECTLQQYLTTQDSCSRSPVKESQAPLFEAN